MEDNDSHVSEANTSGKNPMLLGVIAIVVLFVLAGGYLMINRNTSQPSSTQTGSQAVGVATTMSPSNTEDAITGGGDMSKDAEETMGVEQGVIEIEGGSFYFKPNIIRVKVGQTVKVKLNSVGGMPHDFVIDELGVDTKEITNDSLEFEFTPDKVGNFEFYCSVGSHRKMGMKGTIIVE